MSLQKTGWRIKRFIPHRRKSSLDSGNNLKDEIFTDTKLSTNTPKRLSWISPSPSVEFPLSLGRASSTATARNNHIEPPITTAYSSASSLCSCECNTSPVTVEHSLSTPGSAFSPPEILYLPPLTPTKTSGDAKAWRLIFSESIQLSPRLSVSKLGLESTSTTVAAGSTFDLLEALAIDPTDNANTPTQSIKYTDEPEMGEISDNVEQLIRETDEAFKAVGTALADAKAVTSGWYDEENSMPLRRSFSVARGVLRKGPRSPISPKSPMSRSMSITKPKKKPAKRRTNLVGRAPHTVPPPPTNTPSRWTLTDVTSNMVDVFSGKIFRTEVDEMLTPDRMQQIKNDMRLENERRVSADSVHSADSAGSTPTEPFHLESLTSRIKAAEGKFSFPSPALPPPAMPKSRRRIPNKKTKAGYRKVQFVDPAVAGTNGAEMTIDDMTFPTPPASFKTTLPRRPSPSRAVPLLPTIPERSPLSLTPTRMVDATSLSQRLSFDVEPIQNYILLPATPFTLTSPLFQHGPICVQRFCREPKWSSPDDEPLDWTAFQMAISGTMDDGAEERDEKQWEMEKAELDGIMEWWVGYGYGIGYMEKALPRRERTKNKLNRGWRSDVASKTTAAERKKQSEGRKNREAFDEKIVVEQSSQVDGGVTSWNRFSSEKIMEEHQVQVVPLITAPRRGSSVESLPPSPMLDLVIPSPSKDREVIPMGFNLGHDLGDFLKWEAQNVQTLLADDW